MVDVKLKSSFLQTRKVNCDELQDKVRNVIGPWKGGKFMPLSLRSHSINTYCLSKVWFKCPSINLRVCDHARSLPPLKAGCSKTSLLNQKTLSFTGQDSLEAWV